MTKDFFGSIRSAARTRRSTFYRRMLAPLLCLALLSATGAHAQINDGFQRPDGANLGNGWIEKNPQTFDLENGTAAKQPVGTSYRDNIAYRPASEDLLDVEASVELTFSAADPGYPQLFTRIQSGTVDIPDSLDGYIFYINNSIFEAVLGRQEGANFVDALAILTLTSPLNTTDTFRLRMRTTGTNPVSLDAFVERQDGQNWTIIGQASVNDTAAARFTNPGSVGFGGYVEASYDYDNFVATDLGAGTNPSPTLGSIAPNSATEGGSAFTLTVNGNDFIAGSVVRWDGADRATTFVSANELQANITAADIANAGTATVTVFNPAPGGGTSGGQTFTIDPIVVNNPTPTLGSINPSSATEGGSAFTLTLNGNDFIPGSVVRWDGADRATTFVSANELQANITAADIANAGTATVTVFNPAPGGGISGGQTFTIDPVVINNPTPTLGSINPNSATEGGSAFTLTVNGNDFIPGSVVRWDGADRGTTFVSANELQANITAADIANAGNATVTVFNPAPGGGTSAGQTFTIDPVVVNNPTPTLGSINPDSATEGGAAFTLTLNGNDFIAGSVVRWDGADRATTFVSVNELEANITAADIANAGTATVTVFNPAPGGGISGGQTFTIDPVVINNPTPTLGSINPNSATEGGSAFTLTLNGNDFIAGSVVRWNGADRATTFVSANELQANITAADIANAGTATVTVFNPAPGGGTSGGQTFTIDPVVVNNPTPTLGSINPNSATEGGSAFTLTVNGNDFIPGSVVRWDGADRGTTFVSANELQANITAADIANTGTATVTVFNPAPGGGTSGGQTFTIDPVVVNNPTPTLGSINPNSATEGGSAFTLTVNGSDFIAGSVVRWNGASRGTTFVSANQLQANITAADIANAGTATVTVFNPAPGGGTSADQTFTIDASSGVFLDTFSRPNGANIGNGWIEKNPQAFQLNGNAAAKQAVGTGYRDNVVYRPASEDLLDVEASVVLRLTNATPGYPQLFTRIQSGTAAANDALDGYILYVNGGPNEAVVGRQTGANFVETLAVFAINPGLNTTDDYRLRLRTTGTNPVQVTAAVDRWNGTAWEVIGQANANDNNPARIVTPGAVGFGGYVEASYVYDDFTATDLGSGSNPMPTLGTIAPNSATEGGSAFTLTVNGSDFIPGSIVRWNGADRGTTFVSANQLQANITAADIANAGNATVTVFNPGPGGGTSGAQNFTINPVGVNNPTPTLGAIVPNSATEGGSAFTLTLNGTDFIAAGSVVRWNGADRGTTFISANELQANITAADIANAGTATVTVFNPAPGGGTSAGQTFTINPLANNPVPGLGAIVPNSATEGGAAFTLTLNGNNFIAGSVVRWDGVDRGTTFVSANELQANITAADIANAGTATVTVFNPAPGGGTSGGQTFNINPAGPGGPEPTLLGLSPESVTVGAPNTTVTVIGDNFNAQSVVRWNGGNRATTFISAQTVEVELLASDLNTGNINTVTVANGGDISEPHPFFVLEASEAYFFDNFNTADNPDIGNGWTEKVPDVFAIVNNAVRSIFSETLYRDNVVYRPVAEDRLDVEIGADFIRQPAGQFTQLHARATRSTVANPNFLESYIFYLEDNVPDGAVAIAITPPIFGMGECIIDQINLPEPLRVGDRYRMRFSVTGQNPVRLEGSIDWFVGGVWQPFFTATVFHDETTVPPGYFCAPGFMPDPITAAGATGFSKWADQADDYDNYYWIDRTGVADVPVVTSAQPDSVTAGDPGFTLTVNGSFFVPSSTVQWEGSPRATTFIDSTTLQATIGAADIATPGTADVSVSTPAPGGGVSNTVVVDILQPGQSTNPVPTVAAINPEGIIAGQANLQLTVTGTGFVTDSVVRWNGNDRVTTYVSETALNVTLTPADIATTGTGIVTVFNPTPGGGLSELATVAIVNNGDFVDGFNRPDNPNPQNGWIEKNPNAFTLTNGAMQKNTVAVNYVDNVVYRPAGEARGDVETSVEMRLNNPLPGYPQIFARLQTGTVGNAGGLDGYILYFDNSNVVILGRQVGAEFPVPLSTFQLSEALNTNAVYRLRLSATGTAPVTLTGYIERLTPTGFTVIGQGTAQDNSGQRFVNPGVSGIGGYVEGNFSFDNFRDTDQ